MKENAFKSREISEYQHGMMVETSPREGLPCSSFKHRRAAWRGWRALVGLTQHHHHRGLTASVDFLRECRGLPVTAFALVFRSIKGINIITRSFVEALSQDSRTWHPDISGIWDQPRKGEPF